MSRGVLDVFNRLLTALEQVAAEAEVAGVDGIREWAALAALDAVQLGEELGMLHDTEAEGRRATIRARVEDLDRRR